jgi:hypothetical protein
MFGRSYGWTYDLLIEAGTVMRSQGSRRKQATALVPEYGMHVNTIRRCRT